jgi:WD40 repeat protein
MSLRFSAAVALLLSAPVSLTAADTDLYGDPLPAGVSARFGTITRRVEADALAIRPDGKTIVTVGQGVLREWDAETGKAGAVHRLSELVNFQSFLSPDGKTAAMRFPEELTLWNAAGEVLHTFPCDPGSMIYRAAFSADGQTLATADYDGASHPIHLRTADGKSRKLVDTGGSIETLAFTPDGKRIVAVDQINSAIICWNDADGKEVWRAKTDANYIAFSPDGSMLVSARTSGPIQLWDAATGKPMDNIKAPTVSGVIWSIRFGPVANTLAVSSPDGLLLWDLKAGKGLRRFPDVKGPFAFFPDGKTLACLIGSTLQRWDVTSGKALYPDTRSLGHLAPIQGVVYSADGKLLATVGFDESIRIWDVATRKTLHILPGPNRFVWGWTTFTPDSTELVMAGGDDLVRFWDIAKEQEVRRVKAPRMYNFHLSKDGKILATVRTEPDPTGMADALGVWNGTVTLWDAATGKERSHWTVQNTQRDDVFSADGRWMAVHRGGVYDTATGERFLMLQADQGAGKPFVDSFTFSPDGALVAGALWETVFDGNRINPEALGIQVWELATGAQVARIPTKESCRFAFGPDGRTLAAAGEHAICLWDVAAERELYHRPVPDHLISPYGCPFALAPDGHGLVTGSDTTVLLWDLSPAFRDVPAASALSTKESDALWADLAGADAAKAFTAINRLAARPVESLPLLRERVSAVAPIPAKQMQHWIDDLSDDDLTVRDNATNQLASLGVQAGPALKEALTHDPSPEQRQRINGLLQHPRLLRSGDVLRSVRAVRILEQINSQDSRPILETLAKGDPASPVTQAAHDALARTAAE